MVKFRGLANDAGEPVEEVVQDEGETLELQVVALYVLVATCSLLRGWQEARVTASYQHGLRLMKEKRLADATQVWLETIQDKAFERDITGNPRFVTLRNVQYLCVKNLAAVAEELDDKEAALEWLGQAVALDDRDVVVWHKLGCLAQELDRLHVARCSFERGLCLRPQHQLCMERLCEVTYGIGDFQACESAANQLLQMSPWHSRAMLHKGLAMSRLGKSEMYWQDVVEEAREADPVGVSQLEGKLQASRAKRSRIDRPAQTSSSVELSAISWRCLLSDILVLLKKDENAAEAENIFSKLVSFSISDASTEADADGLTLIKLRKGEKGGGNNEGGSASEPREYDDQDALCTRCGGDNEQDDDLLLCENFELCGRSFHLTCLSPPLSKAPKGKWYCDKCDAARKPAGTPVAAAPGTPKGRGSKQRGREEGGEEGGVGTPAARDDSPNPTPTKKRRSNRFSLPAPDSFRKSLRHSAAAEGQRPVGAEAVQRILSLVMAPDGGAEDVERSDDAPPVEGAHEESAESSQTALSRLQMLQHASVIEENQVDAVTDFLGGFPRPCCLLEIVHRLLHALARLAKQHRARGKVLELLLELDLLASDKLIFAPEASLTLAELHWDAALRKREERIRKKAEEEEERKEAEEERRKAEAAREKERKRQEEKEKKDGAGAPEPVSALVAVAQAAPPDPAAPVEALAEEAPREDPHVAACSLHLCSVWTDQLTSVEDQVRHLWLKARVAEARGDLACAVEGYRRCKDLAGQSGQVLLPSCALGNVISVAMVEKCSREPSAELESQILDARLQSLMSRISAEAASSTNEDIAKEAVQVLAPVVVPEVLQDQEEWLVSKPHVKWACDTEALRKAREKRQHNLCMLLDAFRWLPDKRRQELYAMNVMLAELVGVEQVLVEKEDAVLFQPLDTERLRSVMVTLNYVAHWTAQHSASVAELQDQGAARMLHQLQLQLARLFCRLSACKPETLKDYNVVLPGNIQGPNVFYVAGLVLYRLFKAAHRDSERQKEREMLSRLLEEFVKRNLHLSNDMQFLRLYIPVLHVQRVVLEAEEDEQEDEDASADNEEFANAEEEKEDEDEDGDGDDGQDDEEELDSVMHELAKCYYLLYGVRVKKFKSTYDRVDSLLVRDDDAASRSKPKVDRSPPDLDMCVGLWEFAKALCDKGSGGRAKVLTVSNVKDALESLRAVLPEPSGELACGKELVTSYFRAHNINTRSLTSFSSPFAEQLQGWRAAAEAAARVAEQVVGETATGVDGMQAMSAALATNNAAQNTPPLPSDVAASGANPSVTSEPKDAPAVSVGSTGGDTAAQDAVQTGHGADEGNQPEDIRGEGGQPGPKADTKKGDAEGNQDGDGESKTEAVPEAKKAPEAGDFEGVGRLPEVVRDLYATLAKCYQQSNDKEAAELYTLDLWMHPERVKSWVGLAKALHSQLHTAEGCGIRDCSTLKASPDAEERLFQLFRAWSAVRVLDPANAEARMGCGLVLYLRAQAGSVLGDDMNELRRMAVAELEGLVEAGGDGSDWRAHFLLGILTRKLRRSAEESLEHLYKAALLNTEVETTLGLEPLYKLHSIRAKMLLTAAADVAVLDQYSVLACLERAGEADERCSVRILAATTKWWQQAKQEQSDYEEEVGPLFEGDTAEDQSKCAVLRDSMVAVRAVVLAAKSRAYGVWTYAKGRYRVAQIMAGRDTQPAEKRTDFVLRMLYPMFFNDKDVVLANNVTFSFMQFSQEQAKLATYSNLSTLIRLKVKTISLLAQHLRAKPVRADAADRLEKLLDYLAREEKELGKGLHVWRDANSLRKGVVAVVHNYLQVLQDVVVEEAEDAEAVERAFLRLGKLRADLEAQSHLVRGVKLAVHASLDWTKEPGNTYTNTVTLLDKFCPFFRLFRGACATHCKGRGIPYHETQHNDRGQRCMGSAMGIWSTAHKRQQLVKAAQASRLKGAAVRTASSKQAEENARDVEMTDSKANDGIPGAVDDGAAGGLKGEPKADSAGKDAKSGEEVAGGIKAAEDGPAAGETTVEPEQPPAPKQFFVVVPANVSAGMSVLLSLPGSTEKVSVLVPDGKGPGDRFIYTHPPN